MIAPHHRQAAHAAFAGTVLTRSASICLSINPTPLSPLSWGRLHHAL